MSYKINKTNGSVLVNLSNNKINQDYSQISLIGFDYNNHGNLINQNFVKLLDNFCDIKSPNNPIEGQIWYDQNSKTIGIYNDNLFSSISNNTLSIFTNDSDLSSSTALDGIIEQLNFLLPLEQYSTGFTIKTLIYNKTQSINQQFLVIERNNIKQWVRSGINGEFSGTVTEGDIGDESVTAQGELFIYDPEDTDASFKNVYNKSGKNNYGVFKLIDGVWTYTLNQSAVQSLTDGEIAEDYAVFTATNGQQQKISVTILGTNDESIISGDRSGTITEGAETSIQGQLTIIDPDSPGVTFNDISLEGDYGYFSINNGSWVYSIDVNKSQTLGEGDQAVETFTIVASNGEEVDINITVQGADNPAVISGNFTGTVSEGDEGDAPVTVSGTLEITDIDDEDNIFNTLVNQRGDNDYGTFDLIGNTWTYTLDQSAVQNLNISDQVTDSITYTSVKGDQQKIEVTIQGTDDGAVIFGDFTGTIFEGNIEDAVSSISGTLSINDADDDVSFAPVFNMLGSNSYGVFDLIGQTWTYTLNQASVQSLGASDTVTDSATFTASNGDQKSIEITIQGTDDSPIIVGDFTGTVSEGDLDSTDGITAGSLNIVDFDNPGVVFENVAAVNGDNSYGVFSLNNGAWTYTLDQSSVQSLTGSDTVYDTTTFTATDGTQQTITITIQGTDDIPSDPVIQGLFNIKEESVSGFTRYNAFTVKITADPGDTVSVYNQSVLLGTAQESTTGNYELYIDSLVDGDYAISAISTNDQGTSSEISNIISIQIDSNIAGMELELTVAAGDEFTIYNSDTEGSYSGEIDWGDGYYDIVNGYQKYRPHVYESAGTYNVVISGTWDDLSFLTDSTVGDYQTRYSSDKISSVITADNITIKSLFRGFTNANKITSFPDDLNTSEIISLYESWSYCTSLISFPQISLNPDLEINGLQRTWFECSSLTEFPLIDLSGLNNVDVLNSTWKGCSSLTEFPLIDTSSIVYFYYTWENCSSLTSFPEIDTSQGQRFAYCWNNCSSLTDFPLIDLTSADSISYTWEGCSSLQSFPAVSTSTIRFMQDAWKDCSSLTSFPYIDLSSCLNIKNAWWGCSLLTSFPTLDTSNVIIFDGAWRGCELLESFPYIDTSSASTIRQTWENCYLLTSFPLINTALVDDFYAAWRDCRSLTEFPEIDTSSATDMTGTWSGCELLTSFPSIDTSNCTNLSSTWSGCELLTSFPSIDTSNCTNLSSTWRGCELLTSFPSIDTSNCTNLSSTWNSCKGISDFSFVDTSNVEDMSSAFYWCISCTNFPDIITDKCAWFIETWSRCYLKTTVENINIDLKKITRKISFRGAFNSCDLLEWKDKNGNTSNLINFINKGADLIEVNYNCFSETWEGCTSITPAQLLEIINIVKNCKPYQGTLPNINYQNTYNKVSLDFNGDPYNPGTAIENGINDLVAIGWKVNLRDRVFE